MKHVILISIALLFAGIEGFGQFGYDAYQKVNGLQVSTKWGKAKNESGDKKPALLLAFENTNEFPVAYSFDIMLYYEGMLRETGRIEGYCLDGLKSSVGKLNGIYFIPEKFTADQLSNSDFNFVIENIEVEQIDECSSVEE